MVSGRFAPDDTVVIQLLGKPDREVDTFFGQIQFTISQFERDRDMKSSIIGRSCDLPKAMVETTFRLAFG